MEKIIRRGLLGSNYQQSWFNIPAGMSNESLNQRGKTLFELLCKTTDPDQVLHLRVMFITTLVALWMNNAQRGQDDQRSDRRVGIAELSRACVWVLDVIASGRYDNYVKPWWHLCNSLNILSLSAYDKVINGCWGFVLSDDKLMLGRPGEAGCYDAHVTQFNVFLNGRPGGADYTCAVAVCLIRAQMGFYNDSIYKRFARKVKIIQDCIRHVKQFLVDRLGYHDCAALIIELVVESVHRYVDLPIYRAGDGARRLIYSGNDRTCRMISAADSAEIEKMKKIFCQRAVADPALRRI